MLTEEPFTKAFIDNTKEDAKINTITHIVNSLVIFFLNEYINDGTTIIKYIKKNVENLSAI